MYAVLVFGISIRIINLTWLSGFLRNRREDGAKSQIKMKLFLKVREGGGGEKFYLSMP